MDILGIGPLELVFIFILMLIVLGPNDMVKTGRTIGEFIGKLVRSDFWKAFQTASNEISALPHKLAREAELDTLKNEIAPLRAKAGPKLSPNPSSDLNIDGWVTKPEEQPEKTQPEETAND